MFWIVILVAIWLLIPASAKAVSRFLITRASQDTLVIADKGLDALESATGISQKDWDVLVKKATSSK